MTKPPSELAGNNPGQHAVHDRQDIQPAAEQAPSFSSMDTDAETFNALYQSPGEASAYANKRPSSKRTGEGPHKQKNATGDTTPSTAVSRILARVRSPEVVINNKDLPAEVLRPMQATGVIAKEALPVVSMAFLTALGAASASSTTCEPARELGGASGIGIKLCIVSENRDVTVLQSPPLVALYAVQNELVDRHRARLALSAAIRRSAAERRMLHDQAVKAARELGHPAPPPLLETAIDDASASPQIVVREAGPKAFAAALAGGTNLLVMDKRRMPNFARIGCGDQATADDLNSAARGHATGVHDRETGHVTFRSATIGSLGVMSRSEFDNAVTMTADELLGAAFVSAATILPGGDDTAFAALLRQVHALTSAAPVALKLTEEAVSLIVEAARRWNSDLDTGLHPWAAYVAQLPDLCRRIAVSVHLASAAGTGSLKREVTVGSARRAVSLVDQMLLPAARQLLEPISTASQAEADARRLVAILRAETDADDPNMKKRDLQRCFSAPERAGARFRSALRLLQELELIGAGQNADGSKAEAIAASAAVYA